MILKKLEDEIEIQLRNSDTFEDRYIHAKSEAIRNHSYFTYQYHQGKVMALRFAIEVVKRHT